MILILIFIWLVMAILVGVYASSKGRSGIGFFILSMFISPLISFLVALLSGTNNDENMKKDFQAGRLKKCPACAELVKVEALKCKHCNSDLPKIKLETPEVLPQQDLFHTKILFTFLGGTLSALGLIAGAGSLYSIF